jgi:HD domain
MLDPGAVTDELRARVRAELPEVEEIRNPELAARVVEAWTLALASSSFGAIAEIEPSGNPGVNTLKCGSQTDHIRGVTRMAMALADQLSGLLPDLEVDRDLLIAGALCHDIGKPWEFDPENRRRWGRASRAVPACRQSATRLSACMCAFPSACRRRSRIAPRRIRTRASSWCARSRTRSSITPTMPSGASAARATS